MPYSQNEKKKSVKEIDVLTHTEAECSIASENSKVAKTQEHIETYNDNNRAEVESIHKDMNKRNSVKIIGLNYDKEEVLMINKYAPEELWFSTVRATGISSQDVIMVIISLAQGVGANCLYDILKYVLNTIILKTKKLRLHNKIVELTTNDKTVSFRTNCDLSQEQTDKLIDAVIQRIIAE